MKQNKDFKKGPNAVNHSVLLAFGSNLGDRREYIASALSLLAEHSSISLVKTSSFYSTEPMGKKDQPDFLNSAALISTPLSPDSLLTEIKNIETKIGRQSRGKWCEREIDIDILLYDNLILELNRLTIPHKDMTSRNFVLIPAAEIAPEWIHPVSGKTIFELMQNCSDSLQVNISN